MSSYWNPDTGVGLDYVNNHNGGFGQVNVTCREAVDAHQVPVTIPQCCRRSSIARQPSDRIFSGTFPLVSLPLAVPFPAECALSECSS
jgi:hypothetical protein